MCEKSKGKTQKAKLQFKSQNFEFYLVIFTFAFLLLSWSLFFSSAVEACPGCKEALFDPGQLQQKLSTAKGYALSITLLLCVPVTLIGGIATLIVRARRHPVGTTSSTRTQRDQTEEIPDGQG